MAEEAGCWQGSREVVEAGIAAEEALLLQLAAWLDGLLQAAGLGTYPRHRCTPVSCMQNICARIVDDSKGAG